MGVDPWAVNQNAQTYSLAQPVGSVASSDIFTGCMLDVKIPYYDPSGQLATYDIESFTFTDQSPNNMNAGRGQVDKELMLYSVLSNQMAGIRDPFTIEPFMTWMIGAEGALMLDPSQRVDFIEVALNPATTVNADRWWGESGYGKYGWITFGFNYPEMPVQFINLPKCRLKSRGLSSDGLTWALEPGVVGIVSLYSSQQKAGFLQYRQNNGGFLPYVPDFA